MDGNIWKNVQAFFDRQFGFFFFLIANLKFYAYFNKSISKYLHSEKHVLFF